MFPYLEYVKSDNETLFIYSLDMGIIVGSVVIVIAVIAAFIGTFLVRHLRRDSGKSSDLVVSTFKFILVVVLHLRHFLYRFGDLW